MDRSTTLNRMTEALAAAKRARDRGVNVSEVRKGLKAARAAYEAGDFQAAYVIADGIIHALGAATNTGVVPPTGTTTDPSGGTTTVIEREVVVREIVKIPCRNCGTLVELKDRYCTSCGAPVR